MFLCTYVTPVYYFQSCATIIFFHLYKYRIRTHQFQFELTGRHILLGLQFREVERRSKHEHVGHVDQAVEEGDGGVYGQALRGL